MRRAGKFEATKSNEGRFGCWPSASSGTCSRNGTRLGFPCLSPLNYDVSFKPESLATVRGTCLAENRPTISTGNKIYGFCYILVSPQFEAWGWVADLCPDLQVGLGAELFGIELFGPALFLWFRCCTMPLFLDAAFGGLAAFEQMPSAPLMYILSSGFSIRSLGSRQFIQSTASGPLQPRRPRRPSRWHCTVSPSSTSLGAVGPFTATAEWFVSDFAVSPIADS